MDASESQGPGTGGRRPGGSVGARLRWLADTFLSAFRGSHNRSLLVATGAFASGNLVATFLRLIGGVLTSRFVSPAELGLFNAVSLVQGYLPFATLGVPDGLKRDLPYLLGSGDRERAMRLAAAAQGFSALLTVAASVVIAGIAGWHLLGGRGEVAAAWAANAFIVFGMLFGQRYLEALYRTSHEFGRLARITVVQAVTAFVLVAAVWAFGYYGLCARNTLIWVVSLVLLWRWRPFKVPTRLDWRGTGQLMKTGLPIFIVGQLGLWWPILNSTLILNTMGKTALGLYAVANMANTTIALLPRAMGQVVYPRQAEDYGRTGSIGRQLRMAIMPTTVSLAVSAAVVAVAWPLLPVVVELVLPKYVDGIRAAQWTVLGACLAAFNPVNNIFNVVKRQGRYAAAILIGMGSYGIALWWLLRGEPRLEYFPQAMIFGRIILIVACLAMVLDLWIRERRDGPSARVQPPAGATDDPGE